MKRMYFGIMAIIVICSLCACNNTGEKTQVASGGSGRVQEEGKDVVAINMPDESKVSGRLSTASEKYVYSVYGEDFDGDLCIYQYDYDGNSIKEFENSEMQAGDSDEILYVRKDEIIYLQTFGDYLENRREVIWCIPLKNVGEKSEKPDYKNMKKIMILEAGENVDYFSFYASEKLLAGFFAGEYKEIDRSSGKERKISQNKGQKYYNFSYPFINNAQDGDICSSLGSDLIEDGYVLLTTDYTESKGTLYLHKIGTSTMEKVAEDVYPAQRLISGNGKFFYWGITSMPRDSWTIFDGIWMLDIKTGQQKQLVSKGELQKMTKIRSAGEMFLDANDRLYFEVSKEDLCSYDRVFFSLSPDDPSDLQKEEKITEKLADCQYIKTYFGDTLYFEDGDGEYEEDIYTYDLKSGKIKKLKNWNPFAEVGYMC